MAEEETGQERTEEATPRRLERAREEGQIPRSRELNTAAVLLSGALAMLIFGPGIADRMAALARDSFQIDRAEAFDTGFMAIHLTASVGWTLEGLAATLALLLVVALLAPAALGGWMFSAKPLMPKWERLDPLA
ncbi:MAG: EscU/YscU/HrcU family type III secretion system export apparatus switch protein, partial [Gammaproteobacteria bacterium]